MVAIHWLVVHETSGQMYITVEPVIIFTLDTDGEEPKTEYISEILLPNISPCLIPVRQL